MRFDSVDADEQRARDLLVGSPGRRELDDAPLAVGEDSLARGTARTDARELGARLLAPSGRAELVERGDGGLEGVARGGPFPAPALRAAHGEPRSGGIEAQAEPFVVARRVGDR